jgi:hypothetical protein
MLPVRSAGVRHVVLPCLRTHADAAATTPSQRVPHIFCAHHTPRTFADAPSTVCTVHPPTRRRQRTDTRACTRDSRCRRPIDTHLFLSSLLLDRFCPVRTAHESTTTAAQERNRRYVPGPGHVRAYQRRGVAAIRHMRAPAVHATPAPPTAIDLGLQTKPRRARSFLRKTCRSNRTSQRLNARERQATRRHSTGEFDGYAGMLAPEAKATRTKASDRGGGGGLIRLG